MFTLTTTAIQNNTPKKIRRLYIKMEKIKNVYIIDDDEIIIYLTDRLISEEEFCEKNTTFENGLKALDKIKEVLEKNEALPDLLLVDLNMPVMDGWEFIDQFEKLALPKPIPIFIFTSSINPIDTEKANQHKSIKGYIQKPLTPIKLDKIKRLIS